MKRMVAFLLSVLLLLLPTVTQMSPAVAQELPSPMYGDPNGDGKVSADDALLILKSVVGKVVLNESQRDLARVTAQTGAPDAVDALEVLQHVVGKSRVFSRFGETAVIEKFYSIEQASLRKGTFEQVELVESYEQYTALVTDGVLSGEEIDNESFFAQKSLLIFSVFCERDRVDVTLDWIHREGNTLVLSVSEHQYGTPLTNQTMHTRWYGAQIGKLKQSPALFSIAASHQRDDSVPTKETYRLPNVKHGQLDCMELSFEHYHDVPPAEIEGFLVSGRGNERHIKQLLSMDETQYDDLHPVAYKRFVPVMIAVSFGNLGCLAQIGNCQIDANGVLTLDVTLEMHGGGEVEQRLLYVLWLETEWLEEQGLNYEGEHWLSVTVKLFDENDQPVGTDRQYVKPFYSPIKTTAINNVSFEMVEADASLKLADPAIPFAPFERAGICHSYEEYLQLMHHEILDSYVPNGEWYDNMVSESDFADGRALVVMSSVWNCLGHRLTPINVGLDSLFGDTLYLEMELFSDQSSVNYYEEQHNLCFVWVDGLVANKTNLSVETKRITVENDVITETVVHQEFALVATQE